MKRLFSVVLAGLLGGLAVLLWGWHQWTAAPPLHEPAAAVRRLQIPPGMTLSAAADSLHAQGLLRDPRILRLGARLTGRARDLQAGLYDVEPGLSPRDLLQLLTSGATVQIEVTIPEGLTAREIAAIVAAALDFPGQRFLAAADSVTHVAMIERRLLGSAVAVAAHAELLASESAARGRPYFWCEGYLAPDTYRFAAGSPPATVAAALVASQLARIDTALTELRPAMTADLSPHQLLTLASVVESEARVAGERPQIAAVYVNRLRQNWRLEADPTVAFVLDKKGQRLLYRDLEADSAFNTYQRRGLPPGPIGSPGMASIRAAAQPDTLCDAMFFVSDGRNGHVFSRTAQEHEAAVRRFRQVRAAERRNQGD